MTPARRPARRPSLSANRTPLLRLLAASHPLWLLLAASLTLPSGARAATPRPAKAAQKVAAQKVAAQKVAAPKPLEIHRFTLANGLRVVVQPDHRAPVVALGIMVNVGSRHETPERSGLAHFFEHMMFQGSKHVAKMAHFTGLESAGADLNANTSTDRTYYYEVMPKNALELALWLESDRFAHLAINAANVENQRQTVMEERRQRYDNRPYAASRLKLMKMLFTTWPLQHSVIGSMTDLQKAPLSAFEQFWRHWYTPNNCVLVLVGDVDVAQARELVTKTIGRVERRAEPAHKPAQDPVRAGHTYDTYAEPLGKMPAFHLAFRVPPRDHAESAAIEVLGEVLDGGDASRLSRKLEKDTGLATRFWAGKYGRRDADVFHVAVEVSQQSPAAVAKAKQIVRETLYDIAAQGVTAEELRRAKVGLEARFVFRNLGLAARASLLAQHETYDGDATTVNRALARWQAVTADQVRLAARRWFGWEREVELDVLPKGAAVPAAGGTKPRYVTKWEEQIARREAKRVRETEVRTRALQRREKLRAQLAQRAAARQSRRDAKRKAKEDAKRLKAARAATAEAQIAADMARRKATEPERSAPIGLPAANTPVTVDAPVTPMPPAALPDSATPAAPPAAPTGATAPATAKPPARGSTPADARNAGGAK